MQRDRLPQAEPYTQRNRRRRIWQKVVGGLACAVVFCTTYALILPAITMEKETICGLEEHTHTEACYAVETVGPTVEFLCSSESLANHVHDWTCYDGDGALRCGYADFVIHTHDDLCYDGNGNLICPLPEVRAHEHDAGCYQEHLRLICGQEETGHAHDKSCYTRYRGELACGLEETEGHTHDADCYQTIRELACGLEESAEHAHDDSCYRERTELICSLPETEGHTHTDDCYNWISELTCGLEEVEGHIHDESCYTAETVLTCRKQEAVPHTHDAGCFDENGALICGQTEVLEHQHTVDCFRITEATTESVLICTLPEHTHSSACYPIEEIESDDAGSQLPDVGDTVIGHVWTEQSASFRSAQFYSVSLLNDDLTESTAAPLNVEDYVSSAELYYRTDASGAWYPVEGAADIPGDADFKLVITYSNVPIDDLLAANSSMTYELPELLRNASANGKITSGSTEVGTITAESNTVTLTFDAQWLTDQKTDTNTVINGDFYVEAEADLSQIEDGSPGQIVVGDVTIEIDFEDDIIAKYGNVDITKSAPVLTEETDGDYLTYTLTVTAGADGCPDVRVADTFTKNQSYVAFYEGVTGTATDTNDANGPQETGAPEGKSGQVYLGGSATGEDPVPPAGGTDAAAPGTLVWVIGDMAAYETRSLTYRVRLQDSYTGIQSNGTIQNTATVYSKTNERDNAVDDFTPTAQATLSKQSANPVKNEDGSFTITYTIWVKASDSNSYTLDNVKIIDALNGSLGQNGTGTNLLPYLSYDAGSFKLYQGGVQNQNGSSGLTEIFVGSRPNFEDTNEDGKYNDHFTYYVGSLAPGESKTLIYTVHVDPGAFVEAGNDAFTVKNRVQIYSDDSREDGGQLFNSFNSSRTVSRKAWDRKLAGEKQEASQTISMDGSVYDATGDSISLIANPNSFTVPAGSYQYQVVANEAGDWDLSSASMKDSLNNQHMQFVGYIQVNAYSISNPPSSDITDEAAIAYLKGQTPVNTVWVKIDGTKSFQFTPQSIGLTEKYAYLLTYYAQPILPEGVTQVLVTNEFSLSGEVIIGSGTYIIQTGIKASASVTVEGSNHFGAEKQSWYYEAPTVSSGDWSKGALYWVIQVDGDTIPKDTHFRDLTSGTTHYIRAGSLVGVYTGSLNGQAVSDYDSVEALLKGSTLATLAENSDFSVTKDNTSLTVKLLQDIILKDGQSLYMIVKTEPSSLPTGKRDSRVFNNRLQSSFNGTDWIDHNTASKTLYGSENTFKELGRVFTYPGSGTAITNIQGGTNQAIDTAALNGAAGTFAAWQIHVNYEGNLSGRYRIVEQIPEGMEVAYVRIWWVGAQVTAADKRPTTVQLSSDELTALGGMWTEHALTSGTNGIGNQTTYYYTNGQQVIWDVDNLIAGNGKDTYAVEYQIVCRVTDPDVLLGSESKAFNNTVSLYTMDGEQIGRDSNGVTIQNRTLAKTGTYDPDANGGRYPFKITLNELGEDLVAGSDTITLVDELSDTLTLDVTSIKIVNTRTGEVVTSWTSSVEGQTLKLTLPDNLPLTITYETTVNALPGQTISISNQAHWEGYTSPIDGIISDDNFKYAVGGTVGAVTSPYITIRKMDQYNNQTVLPGATFTLQEMSDSLAAAAGGLTLTGTTGEDGTLTFGKETGQTMQYNTVYCLTETAAPAGYVLDSNPHYFAIVKGIEDEQGNLVYPSFPEEVTCYYLGAGYTYQAFNHKGEASVRKEFRDEGSQSLNKVDGVYRFGIYDAENPTGDPLQTVTITYANGTVFPEGGIAKFADLELGKTYYIYELDDENQPIASNSSAIVNSKLFDVTYTNGPSVTIPADGTAANAVIITNQTHYSALPETGGSGTQWITISGVALMAVPLMVWIFRKRRGAV